MLERRSIGEIAAGLRATYWFVPAVLTTAAVALAGGLIHLDHTHSWTPAGVTASFLPTSVEGARSLLSAIVSSMMTVVAVTFSVTVVALTVASQHYGPRLLNTFMRDRTVQIVLGLLIATFGYSVFVLAAIDARPLHLATAGAIALVAGSVMALIAFVHHVTTSLQVSSVTGHITRDFDEALSGERGAVRGGHGAEPATCGDVEDTDDVRSAGSGYVQRIDEERLCRLAATHGARITITRPPGKYVLRGSILARVSPRGRADSAFSRELNASFLVGTDRTTRNDLEFAIKQLVEIALRGLSPGVNEPFTALACVDRMGLILAAVAERDGEPVSTLRDAASVARVIVPRQSFESMARAAFDPIRIFGGANPAVYVRLLDTIHLLAETITRRAYLDVLTDQARLVMSAAETCITAEPDVAYVRGKYEETAVALGGA